MESQSTMNYSAAVRSALAPASTSEEWRPAPTPQNRARTSATPTRTLTLQIIDYDKARRITNLLKMIEDLQMECMVEGARAIGTAFFEITLINVHSLNEVERRLTESKQ